MDSILKTNHIKVKKDIVIGKKASRLFLLIISLGAIGVIIYSIQTMNFIDSLKLIGFATMIAGASFLIGGLIGFLFGIPRTRLQDSNEEKANETEAIVPEKGKSDISVKPNTNLEQISDWLTKILVGVGLTQINKIAQALTWIGTELSPGFGGFESSSVLAIATVLYYLLCGFMVGFLWTRLYLSGAFKAADKEEDKEAETEEKLP